MKFGIETKLVSTQPTIKSFNEFTTYMKDKYENQIYRMETFINMKCDIEYFVNNLVNIGYLHSDLRIDLINFIINSFSVAAKPLRVLLNKK